MIVTINWNIKNLCQTSVYPKYETHKYNDFLATIDDGN